MTGDVRKEFKKNLKQKYGELDSIGRSRSLYEIGDGAARIYIRYSKVHDNNSTFYGLRHKDLKQLEGHNSFLCFLWKGQSEPLIVPFSRYEEIFNSLSPAGDGQYKVQVFLQEGGTELYISKAGRFNAEGYFGWDELDSSIETERLSDIPEFDHGQVQTLLGSIGSKKNFDVWIPRYDRNQLDWNLARKFECRSILPESFGGVKDILKEVDVIWFQKASNNPKALFEVEHTTPIYSGLLRFNDVSLADPTLDSRFTVVAEEERRSAFVKQLNRPTFKTSGLNEECTFLAYENILEWHNRLY